MNLYENCYTIIRVEYVEEHLNRNKSQYHENQISISLIVAKITQFFNFKIKKMAAI